MNKRIWEYELGNQTPIIDMPVGAEILTVQTQNEILCMWVLVDPKAEKEKRYFEIYGTGHNINYDMGASRNYIGTYQMHNGSLVFHVFEYTGI